MSRLSEETCRPGKEARALSHEDSQRLMDSLAPNWQHESDRIVGEFAFDNYYETQAFVNAMAYVAHRNDHHPETTFGYARCTIVFTTHAVDGLSRNDFICAAQIDRLLGDEAAAGN